ncbi:helix-turn-helix transcriptional regulator [Bilophila wadsworthia]|uniref:helix-turn-helix transcriptional regulator n=3 Tax=Bilophila wadsworthia TaxID=35833 RepID=UPI001EDB7290|nr:helix-turn-helix transcriptional regulator [Bilophila wadsworthia]MCG4633603.1 helix-turn-helix transcriptional regulator [Bilophila wadsworthia]MDR3812362.1 helix-turn-helix transcriptional regulator [Bilophila sp.]MDU4374978.1 helix-turn-helix transcriptional regulator [Bilophila wadsworthia]
MRHQERNVSEFDEIITYPPSAAPSGEKQVMSCVQAFTAALGFAMSAGWDWLPSMHTLWLRDYIEAVSMPTPFGFFGTLSGSIFFKMIMLLALCPVMERLFHAFPLDRVAFRRKPFPNADYALLPPALRERIYLSTPLILSQLCAILLLLVLTFSLPPCLDGLMPWLLGTVSALFGLIWFVLVTLLPGVWSGISYGLAITFSILISLLLDTAPAESLARFRMLFPILAIPLIFFAMPPSDDIRRRIRRHHRQRLFSTRVKGVLLRGLLLRRLSYLDILSKQGSVYLVLCVFPIMYGVQILLDFSIGCPMVSFNLMLNPPLERHAFLIMSGEISGAFLASSLIAFFPSHSLLVPMLGLSLFGCGSLLTSVFPSQPLNSVAFYIMQLSSGCCAAFGLFVLHQFFQRSGFLFRTLSRALFLLTLFGSMGGYLLWKFADNIHNSYLSSHALFMHLLTIGAILGLFFVYLIRRPLRHLMVTTPRRSLEEAFVPIIQEDPFEQLTPREREVAELVQTGMKNLEISVKLNITETTLRVHLRRIYRKLGIQGRSNLRDFNSL